MTLFQSFACTTGLKNPNAATRAAGSQLPSTPPRTTWYQDHGSSPSSAPLANTVASNIHSPPTLPTAPAMPFTHSSGDNDLPLRHDHRWSFERHVAVLAPRHHERPAGHVDPVRRPARHPVPQHGGHDRGARTGAAGARLADPALVHAHPDVPVGDVLDVLHVEVLAVRVER